MHLDHLNPDHETYQFAGGLMTVLVDGAFTGGRYSLLLADIPPGNTTPPHFHDEDSETLVMLEGAMTIETPRLFSVLNPGETATLAPGQVHRLSNAQHGSARYLLLCAPSGFEDFVRQAGTRVNDSAAQPKQMEEGDIRLLVENAPAYGVRLTDGIELAQPASAAVSEVQHETFIAFGTSIEILARFGDDEDGVVLIRATAMAPGNGRSVPQPSPVPAATQFFAGTTALNGSRHGRFAATAAPTLLAVTTGNVLRSLREDSMSELIIADGGPLGRLLLVLSALHAVGVTETPAAIAPPAARRSFPIH